MRKYPKDGQSRQRDLFEPEPNGLGNLLPRATRPKPIANKLAKGSRRYAPPTDPHWWASFVAPSVAEFEQSGQKSALPKPALPSPAEHTRLVAERLASVDVERFRLLVATFCESLAPTKPPKRRPTIGVRLQHDGFRFLVRPHWDERRRRFDCSILSVDAFRSDDYHSLKLVLTPSGARWARWTTNSEEALDGFRSLVLAFLDSPEKVFRGSAGQCCICGRTLDDPLSRSRGIGPECYGNATRYFLATIRGGRNNV